MGTDSSIFQTVSSAQGIGLQDIASSAQDSG